MILSPIWLTVLNFVFYAACSTSPILAWSQALSNLILVRSSSKFCQSTSQLHLSNISDVAQFTGAGTPRSTLDPGDIPTLLMKALELNDFPEIDSGLTSMWEFSDTQTKYIFKNNITDFINSALETAETFPTSFYGVALNGQSWVMESEINRVGGDEGWIATQVMKTVSSDDRVRRWQWVLHKNRRPPCLGCWYVESIGSSGRKGNFEAED